MSLLLNAALKSLTIRVNLKTGLTHPLDESAAKELFQLLRQEKEELHEQEVTKIAIELGWHPKDAQALGQLAAKIGAGGRVVIKHKGQWKTGYIEQLKKQIFEK